MACVCFVYECDKVVNVRKRIERKQSIENSINYVSISHNIHKNSLKPVVFFLKNNN